VRVRAVAARALSIRAWQGAEINASLHALKECLRAIAAAEASAPGAPHVHVPYRASTLTRVLSESFTHPRALVGVLATVSPGCTDTEHTLHTLHTVTAMCRLDGRTSEVRVDVPFAAAVGPLAPPPPPPKDWNRETLAEWMGGLRQGRYRACVDAMPPDIDGKRICRKPATYFVQVLCRGDEALGVKLYNDLHAEMDAASRAKQRHVEQMRNIRSAAKHAR